METFSVERKGVWTTLIHNQLFVALTIWFLSQIVFVVGGIVSFTTKTNQLSRWQGTVDGIIDRLDKQGTLYGHFKDDQEDKDIQDLQLRMKRVEEDTRHVEVLESENRRLTRDVEDLRNGKK